MWFISASHLIHGLEGVDWRPWLHVLWDHDGNWVLCELGRVVVAVLHVDIQLHQVAAGKRLREVGHLHLQHVLRPLLVVQLAHQIHVALQTVHHEGTVAVCPSHHEVGDLALQYGVMLVVWEEGADDRARGNAFHDVQGHGEHVGLRVGPGGAENLKDK